jgi:hypothetical protein
MSLFVFFYFFSNSCLTCFGQPCAHHQELTTAWCYSLVLVCAVVAGRLSKSGWQVVRPWMGSYHNWPCSGPVMLSNNYKRNNEYKKWHLVGFSYPHPTHTSLGGGVYISISILEIIFCVIIKWPLTLRSCPDTASRSFSKSWELIDGRQISGLRVLLMECVWSTSILSCTEVPHLGMNAFLIISSYGQLEKIFEQSHACVL